MSILMPYGHSSPKFGRKNADYGHMRYIRLFGGHLAHGRERLKSGPESAARATPWNAGPGSLTGARLAGWPLLAPLAPLPRSGAPRSGQGPASLRGPRPPLHGPVLPSRRSTGYNGVWNASPIDVSCAPTLSPAGAAWSSGRSGRPRPKPVERWPRTMGVSGAMGPRLPAPRPPLSLYRKTPGRTLFFCHEASENDHIFWTIFIRLVTKALHGYNR